MTTAQPMTEPSTKTAVPAMTSAKFVVAGGFGVGKTTFVGAVSEIPPLRTEENLTEAAAEVDDASLVTSKVSTTVAMDFGRIKVDQSLMIYLFGTPGQSRFAFMWNTIVDGALGAVVLVDPRRLDESFGSIDYFEQLGLPFIVAQNVFPDDQSYGEAELRDLLALRDEVPVASVVATDTESVKATLIFLIDHLVSSMGEAGKSRRIRRHDLGNS